MITVRKGDITLDRSDVIVSPESGIGLMSFGISLKIRDVAGIDVQDIGRELLKKNNKPLPVGTVFFSSSGQLRNQIKIYHMVLVEYPNSYLSYNSIEIRIENCLKLAIKDNIKSICFPKVLIGQGDLDLNSVIRIMVNTLEKYSHKIKISIVDQDDEFIESLKEVLK
jgi:O-acetyl-ADP-ribose deacetylase (regulator of RNase III)